MNGQDDHEIHCFKPGQPCEAGRGALEQVMLSFNADGLDDSDEDDPFASDVDEDENERNQFYIDESPEQDLQFDTCSDTDSD